VLPQFFETAAIIHSLPIAAFESGLRFIQIFNTILRPGFSADAQLPPIRGSNIFRTGERETVGIT
jgi:hypothetical protein